MIKIAVIDDGISKNRIEDLVFNIEIDKDCRVVECSDNVQDNSHGTICAMIIKKYAPEALVGSIKILQTYTERGYVAQFKIALDWCIQNDISLINISLGSTQSYDSSILYECIENAYKNGIIIIAALSNKNIVTYPASFQNVIGVKTDPLLDNDMFYINQDYFEGSDIVASSKHNIENTITQTCNSYAAPLITAKVNNILNENRYRTVENIKIVLNDISYKKTKDYNPCIMLKRYISTKNINGKPIDIPCVIVKYESSDDNTIHLLNNMFNQNGYSTLSIIITNGCDTPNNLHIVNVDHLDDHALKYLISKYDADIVLVGIDGTSKIDKITCDLLFIQDLNDNITMNNFALSKNITFEIKEVCNMSYKLADYIYQKAIKYLS